MTPPLPPTLTYFPYRFASPPAVSACAGSKDLTFSSRAPPRLFRCRRQVEVRFAPEFAIFTSYCVLKCTTLMSRFEARLEGLPGSTGPLAQVEQAGMQSRSAGPLHLRHTAVFCELVHFVQKMSQA